jgi:hypothetical protein
MRRAVLTALVGLALVSACRKPARRPSPEYAAAQARFVSLYAEKMDEAYRLPEMDDLLSQLGRVPADSLDAQVAQALAQRIRDGRTRLEADEAARAKAAAEAAAAAAPLPVYASKQVPAAAPAEAPAEPAPAAAPRPGMTVQEFDRAFGTCFAYGRAVKVADKGMADTRLLNDRLQCQQRLPGFDKQVVLFQDGKVLGVIDRAQYDKPPTPRDGGTPAPPQQPGK